MEKSIKNYSFSHLLQLYLIFIIFLLVMAQDISLLLKRLLTNKCLQVLQVFE
jgi:hypothetical protein